MAIAVRHFALIVTQRALLALPARIALTFAVNVFATLRAQDGTDAWKRREYRLLVPHVLDIPFCLPAAASLTLTAIVATEAGIALAVSEQTLTIAGAAVRAVLGHILRDDRVERNLLRVTIVVVD